MRQSVLYLVALLCLGAGAARAQVYEPGFLVKANGDTLRGEIENEFWREPPTFIRFRPVATAPSVLLLPRQLRAVGLTGGRLFRYEALPIDHAATTRLEDVPPRGFTAVVVDTLLAEVLVDGLASLRRVVDSRVTHYLVARPGRPLLDLSERRYQHRTADGQQVVIDGNDYHNQLSLYFQDCAAAFGRAQKIPFTVGGVAAVVQAYNASCGPGQQRGRSYLAPARRQVAFQGGVLAGARYNRLESPAYQLAGECTDCGLHPFGGLYAELLQPSRTAAVYGELTVSSFRNRGIQTRFDATSATFVTAPFGYQAMLGTARIGLRFFAPLAHDQLLLFTFGFEHNTVFHFTIDSPAFSSATPGQASDAYAKTTLLPNFGVGWRRQRLTISLDGQLYSNYDSDRQLTTFLGTNIAARLGVGYRLGRHPDAHPKPQPTP